MKTKKEKYTVGNWVHNVKITNTTMCTEIVCGNKTICRLTAYEFWNCSIGEANANAKLIAAAPELLKACQLALSEINNPKRDGSLAVGYLETAIKKATENNLKYQ